MPPPERRRRTINHSLHGRTMLTLLLILLGAANMALAKFSFWSGNPVPLVRGFVIGGALISLFLIAAIWARIMWARYVLIILNWGMIAVFSMPGLMILNARAPGQRPWLMQLVIGLLLYIFSNLILILSRSIRRLATPPSSGR